MRYTYLPIVLFILSCGASAPAVRPEAHVCQMTVTLSDETVCLDGEWVLSSGILGEDAVYRFRKERGYYVLVPVLDAAKKGALREKINPASLDMLSLEQVLSIQGTLYQDMLFFEQYNALVPWQETARIRLYWRGTQFEGSSETLSAQQGNTKTQKVFLRSKSGFHS